MKNGSPLPGARRAGTGRPRPASAVRKTVAAHTLAALDDAASRDALQRQMSGGIIACDDLVPTRITEAELAAMNRRAGFPASQRVARSRRPQPSSTGTAREGSAQRVSRTEVVVPTHGSEPERSERVARDGAPRLARRRLP